MKIYDSEIKLGLSDKITASLIVSTVSEIGKSEKKTLSIPIKGEKLLNEYSQKDMEECVPEGILCVHNVLVSTNWNKNDDIFTPAEVWNARYTPQMKPISLGHYNNEDDQVCGVITKSWAANKEYQPVYSNDNGEPPEDFYNILCQNYIWEKYFPTTASVIKAGIDNKTMFVSMEAWIKDFGYGLREVGSEKVILMPRNEITAWLTGSLRRFAGTGKVVLNGKEYEVGRWLRDINFAGVGYVEKPANPESINFQDYISKGELISANFRLASSEEIKECEEKIIVSKKSCVLENKGKSLLWQI